MRIYIYRKRERDVFTHKHTLTQTHACKCTRAHTHTQTHTCSPDPIQDKEFFSIFLILLVNSFSPGKCIFAVLIAPSHTCTRRLRSACSIAACCLTTSLATPPSRCGSRRSRTSPNPSQSQCLCPLWLHGSHTVTWSKQAFNPVISHVRVIFVWIWALEWSDHCISGWEWPLDLLTLASVVFVFCMTSDISQGGAGHCFGLTHNFECLILHGSFEFLYIVVPPHPTHPHPTPPWENVVNSVTDLYGLSDCPLLLVDVNLTLLRLLNSRSLKWAVQYDPFPLCGFL